MGQFRKHSITITKLLNTDTKKKEGIFFTPKKCRQIILDNIFHHFPWNKDTTILEPSSGSGEFILDIQYQYPDIKDITAIEKNSVIYDKVKDEINCNLIHDDFLQYTFDKQFDIIIGNPPYFVLNKQDRIDYCERLNLPVNGKKNIYSLFLYKSILLLKENGYIGFIIPSSWMNGVYYNWLRSFMYQQGTVVYLENFNNHHGFIDTSYHTICFIFQKKYRKTQPYLLKVNNNLFYSFHTKQLKKLTKNTTTIHDLGCSVITGPCVWNQNKDILSDDPNCIPLIYTSNLVKNTIILKSKMTNGKKQYIQSFRKIFTAPSILLNRGYGNSSKFNFTLAWCDLKEYTCENHVNMIIHTNNNIDILDRIYQSLKKPETKQWCNYFIGNGQLSKTEIEFYLPIFQ